MTARPTRPREDASILHVDLDAFFAAVEQRDKPSLRGKPVIVGGTGGRGVVATASYEARVFGVGSAMSGREARNRCPHAAFLTGRHHIYRHASDQVMKVLRQCTPLVEPLSLDEAFLDLRAADLGDYSMGSLISVAEQLVAEIFEVTGGLTASVGIGTSKLMAKIASDLHKPSGLVAVPPGTELMLLHPMPVKVIPGVGPATAQRLSGSGLHTVSDLAQVGLDELIGLIGAAHGQSLYRLSRADDDRAVVAEREAKSISVEDTYDTDLTDRRLLAGLIDLQAAKVGERLRAAKLSGRTITLKVRHYDFTTLTRSSTLVAPTDKSAKIGAVARSLLHDIDTSAGLRLVGVAVSGLADWIQDDLFDRDSWTAEDAESGEQDPSTHEVGVSAAHVGRSATPTPEITVSPALKRKWRPGADVEHSVHGRGWVWGSGLGRVTVRFETASTPAGPIKTFSDDDVDLSEWRPTEPERSPSNAPR